MTHRAHELRQAERLRTCEELLDQIRAEALVGLDAWFASDLQQSLQKIHRLADLGLEGRRVFRVADTGPAPSPKPSKRGKSHE